MEEESVGIPSFDKMKGDLVRIYPDGNLQQTYARLVFFLQEINDKDGNPLTYDFLIGKFEQHIKQWNYLYKRKEGAGYLSKDAEAKRKTFHDFLGEKLYENEYNIQKGTLERDSYLFGPFSFNYLERELASFELIFKHGK